MLSKEEIQGNKELYISIIKSINRDFNKQILIDMLNETDFFIAPASSKYHGSYPGGLCEHSLAVWKNFMNLVSQTESDIDPESGKIICLCHDFAKINYYTEEIRNKKVYSENGSKSDSLGKYDWVSVKGYSIRDVDNRFIYGNHECTSELIARSYIPLTYEESSAILHHHAGMSADCAKDDIGVILNKNPLALFLHLADMLAAYIDKS